MQTRLSPKFWCALTLFSLIGQIAWVVENMYLNVFIYKMFSASAADISLMVMASAVSATLTTVFIGALSDKIGKRKLFICGGYILWGISILGFVLLRTDIINALFPSVLNAAALGVSLVITLDCVMTFFGSSANDAAFNAWITDSADSGSRGKVEGINAMMPLVAILAVFGGFMAFNLDDANSWTVIFTIIGAVVTLIGIVGIFIIEDTKCKRSDTPYFKNVIYGFLPSTVNKNRSLYFYLFAFIIFNISIQIFMPYLIIYYEVSLQMANYVFIMAPAIILASVATVIFGRLYDKHGFSKLSIITILILMFGYLLLYIFKSTLLVFLGSLLMMCGYLIGMAVFGAKIRELTPEGKAGRFQGIRIFSQVLIPGVVGPFIGKTVLKNAETIVNNDGTVSFVPNKNIFLAALIVLIPVLLFLIINILRKKPRTVELTTPFEENAESSWSDYPRPNFKRDSYLSLCGEWDLSVKSKKNTEFLGKIAVPYPPESRISGINRALKKGEQYIYTKEFLIEKDFNRGKIFINFGAVDQIAEVYINNKFAGSHTGGYTPFSFDITDLLNKDGEKNEITVKVTDKLDTDIPYGKQRKKRGGMWYTPISGIWQPVWLESVCENYIEALRITPNLKGIDLYVVGGESEKTVIIKTESGEITHSFSGSKTRIDIDSPCLWSPENPYLYEFKVVSGKDTVDSYFALRTVDIQSLNGKAFICLNGKPYFFNGLLDQGYFSDGIYTPYSPDGFLYDIKTMKSLGFNMLRKHIKIEPQLFYYYCDKYGMIVFQDMVNSGKYSFLIDTALPTLCLKSGVSHTASSRRRELFLNQAKETVDFLYNHPCVCYYTVFNEGWGQFDADNVYTYLKALDTTRIFDATSGWFKKRKSDVSSEHIYFKTLNLKQSKDRPVVLSEFGGYSCKIENHSFNLDKTYGYKVCKSISDFENDLESLFINEVIPQIDKGLNATVLTQLSDVEDETNGIVTYDRKVLKLGIERAESIFNRVYDAFYGQFK